MSSFGLRSIKNALSPALEYLPDWKNLNPFDKGKVIDKSFKAILIVHLWRVKSPLSECTEFVTLF
jgi:hypothetical protein